MHDFGKIIDDCYSGVGTGQCPVPTGNNIPRYGLLSKIVKSFKI